MRAKTLFVIFFVTVSFILSIHFVIAHGAEETRVKKIDWADPFLYVKGVALWLVLMTILVIIGRRTFTLHKQKLALFWLMVIPVVLASVYLTGYTLYGTLTSETKGPVHWHADYQVWACGERLELREPGALSNRVGSPVLHEHRDDRIHIEGTLRRIQEYDLEHYFEAVGGEISAERLSYPTEDEGLISYNNGDVCLSGERGTLKVYVNGRRIKDFTTYIPYPHSYVPPGDCIIVTFDSSENETTSLLCASWKVAGWNYQDFKRGKVQIGGHSWQ